jgi:hypothetical protein
MTLDLSKARKERTIHELAAGAGSAVNRSGKHLLALAGLALIPRQKRLRRGMRVRFSGAKT